MIGFALGVVLVIVVAWLWFSTRLHESAMQELRDAHVSEILHIEDACDRRVSEQQAIYERAWVEIRAEREQLARLRVSTDPANYGALDRLARTPDEALGEADRHRAEALATRRPAERMPSPMLVEQENGDPIIPVGMGG